MPCVNSRRTGSSFFDQAQVAHHLGPEARIDQVQNRVLHAADVLVDGKPVLRDRRIERRVVVLRVRIAIEVPARIDKRVHRVGLALRRPAALGAGRVHKLRHARQRRAALLRNLDLLRQQHRQLLVRHRNQPVLLAVNHGNRRAPVALPAHAPILQAKGDLRLAKSACARRPPAASSAPRAQLSPSYSPEFTSTPSSETNGSTTAQRLVLPAGSPAQSAGHISSQTQSRAHRAPARS